MVKSGSHLGRGGVAQKDVIVLFLNVPSLSIYIHMWMSMNNDHSAI